MNARDVTLGLMKSKIFFGCVLGQGMIQISCE